MTSEETLQPIGSVTITPPDTFENAEWVFQFDDDEPQLIATATTSNPTEITFTIQNNNQSKLDFYGKDGKRFKIFTREKNL